MYALALIGYHFLFFRKVYQNPFILSTAEIASTFFPHWLWMGRKWRMTDDIYYKYPASIPFLSMFYPSHVILAYISKFICIDKALILYIWHILSHFLIGSFLSYWMFRQWTGETAALFGAITLTYSGYMIRPQTPCFAFTAAWMPGMFLDGWNGAFCAAMAILGGYWPILVYVLPVAAMANPVCLWGLILALPQIIPFLWYWPRSVRHKQKVDRNFGRVPWWKLFDFFIPNYRFKPINGVHFWEHQMYIGITILFIWQVSWWWTPLISAVLVLIGYLPSIQHVPARALYLLTFGLTVLAGNQK